MHAGPKRIRGETPACVCVCVCVTAPPRGGGVGAAAQKTAQKTAQKRPGGPRSGMGRTVRGFGKDGPPGRGAGAIRAILPDGGLYLR